MPALPTDLLAELIQRKHACLVELREMGRRQFETVVEGSITALLDVLAAKQRVLGALQAVERELDPFRGQDPHQRPWRSPEARQACAATLAQCEALLGEILAQEKQSERELVRRRDEAAARLRGIHAAGQARGAYLPGPHFAPGQLDLMSET
jgi:hypothetical protein